MEQKMKNQQHITVNTAEGQLAGTAEGEIAVFKGIPYAAPPTGERRWRPPAAVTPWHGCRDALAWGSASWQSREVCMEIGGGDPALPDEDCLYLNVWTPEIEPVRPLPVIVWIHGGGYALGAGSLAPYSGKPLAARGVVMVTLNYRLGHLGFFAHPALDAEYPAGKTINNFALLDQIAALQWVQRNIPAFGGDRHNVTIMGESSGARSVLSLFCSPLAQGLFHKGIAQSAYALPDVSRTEALALGEKVARHFFLEQPSVEQLRALPAEALTLLPPGMRIGPTPIAGDAVLPLPMLKVFARARQHKLPILIGSNSDESSVLDYFGVNASALVADLRRRQRPVYKLLNWMYDLHDDRALGRAVSRDMAFTAMSQLVVAAQCRVGMPGWRYWFDYVSERSRDLCPDGAWHGAEIVYTLNTLDQVPAIEAGREITDGDRAFAEEVSQYWLNFARYATPFTSTLDGKIAWPAWRPDNDITLCLGRQGEAHISLKENFMKRRLRILSLFRQAMVKLK